MSSTVYLVMFNKNYEVQIYKAFYFRKHAEEAAKQFINGYIEEVEII